MYTFALELKHKCVKFIWFSNLNVLFILNSLIP